MKLALVLLSIILATSTSYAKSTSSSRSYSSSSYKSSSYKPTSKSKTRKSSLSSRAATYTTSTSRCTGTSQPFVEYDFDDREYEFECAAGRELNRYGTCECK